MAEESVQQTQAPPEGGQTQEVTSPQTTQTPTETKPDPPKKADTPSSKVIGGMGETKKTEVRTEPKPVQQSSFANPFVEELNKMYAEGKPKEHITKYLQLHSLDIDGMTYGGAVVEQMRLTYPHLTNDEINTLVDEKYGKLPPQDDPNYATAKSLLETKLKVDGATAKEWLKEKQSSFSDPDAQARRIQQQQEFKQRQTTWKATAAEIANKEFSLSHSLQNDKIGKGTYALDFKVKLSDEDKQEIQNQVEWFAMNYNLGNGEEDRAKVDEFVEAMLWQKNRKAFLDELILDAYASFEKLFAQKYSGVRIPNTQGRMETGKGDPAPKRNSTPGYI